MQGAFDEHFAAHNCIDRDIEQEPREDCGDGGRAFGMGIRQPVVQRGQPHLRAIADEKEHEREPQHGGLELPFHGIQVASTGAP